MNDLNIIELLRPYEVIKQCHYQTSRGFHHEQYDALAKVVRKYGDAFIETFMYYGDRSGLVPRTTTSPLLYGQDEKQIWKVAEKTIDVMYNTMKRTSGHLPALEKLAQDFIQEALQILALIKEYE